MRAITTKTMTKLHQEMSKIPNSRVITRRIRSAGICRLVILRSRPARIRKYGRGGDRTRVTAHEQLESDQPLTLQTLQAKVAQLAALVEEYKQWRQKDEEARNARRATTQPN